MTDPARAVSEIRDLVLVGGGHTHVQVLRRFQMEPPAATRVTVVLDRPIAVYSGMVPGFVAGQYRQRELEIDVLPLARRAGARVVLSAATGIDPNEKRLLVADRPALRYDVVSFDVGSTVAGLDTPGVREHALATRPIATLVRSLDDAIERLRHRERAEDAPGNVDVVVVGAGAGGVEMAFTLESRLRQELGGPVAVRLLDASRELLSGFAPGLARKIRAAARERGIEILLEQQVSRVCRDTVVLESGETLPSDLVVWVTGAAPHPFLRDTPLAKDERGFLSTRPDLRVEGQEAVFAVGDCATIEASPTPKAGVYAVRQGPFLITNLEAWLGGRELADYRPQSNFLTLLNLGDGTAAGAKGPFSFRSRFAMRLKDWIDRRFMRRFQVLGDGAVVSEEFDREMGSSAPMLCGGCAAKLGESALTRALARLAPAARDPDVILGLDRPDDAAAFRTPAGDEVFASVDAFRAFTDDPYLVGRVAALNAASDLEAKGVRPRFALALVTLADPRFARGSDFADEGDEGGGAPPEFELSEEDAEETLVQVMTGAREVFDHNGVSLIGGHTTTGPELVVGFGVLGLRDAGREVLFKGGARAGDRLILTEPLGTGVLLHADMLGRARGPWIEQTFAMMSRGVRRAAELAVEHGAHAATDVTGFGLVGHLAEMLRARRERDENEDAGKDQESQQPAALDAVLSLGSLPVLAGAVELFELGIRSTSHAQNAKARRAIVIPSALAGDPRLELLFDPQTSGGLLIAIDAERAPVLVSELREAGFPAAADVGSVLEAERDVDAAAAHPSTIRVAP